MSASFIAHRVPPPSAVATHVRVVGADIAFSGGRRYSGDVQTRAPFVLPGVLRHTTWLLAASLAALAGCSASRPQVPPRPPLPAVSFVPPCDPQASIGMTEVGVAQLRSRDEAWRTHVEVLEAIIRGER